MRRSTHLSRVCAGTRAATYACAWRGRGWLNTGGRELKPKDFRCRILVLDFLSSLLSPSTWTPAWIRISEYVEHRAQQAIDLDHFGQAQPPDAIPNGFLGVHGSQLVEH
jgi:hypothetical protein